ncbi:hypothetical protein B0I72DRAFT_82301 [Yarrowia lipolytica]|uniref:YALI0C07931p n=2 Tax=Yarrowia lipolytica TaxID=4952 RepID=Q6CCN5_YARLI|nr:YALI0C07931p [Yarrowia lipolytica CLIB122]AOW02499.1 hypothetical protein YALI1_C10534g [Yarrowia lipolytica]KAB8280361.1 hypothetical protein BKA91DRAFT_89816 [Yarrowia lipolytica]KAE8169419.1 hypothetical protein BKA90DRAFT_89856 [Yarrowia lipolytica]KAJ8053193.1 hypothetical protein LXG23DRAFT_22536 [Yarrowia lipolytica]RDW27171.1 hypothetical protein B0I71DRAFT_79747 [Yarrowia lipolytica]|eukprot:XP_501577.1 YALI0C07931p [Yarrowia lipolytica CLIB122]
MVVGAMPVSLTKFLYDQTSLNRYGLHKLKYSHPSDFSIRCFDGGKIGVHKAVLFSTWSFFKAMRDANMKESSASQLELDLPKSTVGCIDDQVSLRREVG